jgi:hypothetical protein
MSRLLEASLVAALLSIVLVCCVLSFQVARMGKAINSVATQSTAQLTALGQTQQQVRKLLVDTKDLIIHSDITEVKESATLDAVNAEVKTTLAHVDQSVVALTVNQNLVTSHLVQTVDATTATVNSVQPVVDNLRVVTSTLNDNLLTLETTERNLNTVISNPAIPDSMRRTDAILTSGQHIAADGEHLVHSYVYPKPIVSVINWTLKVVHAVNPF